MSLRTSLCALLTLSLAACTQTPQAQNPATPLENTAWNSQAALLEGQATRPIQEGINFLSDLAWTSATSGYGPLERDQANGTDAPNDGGPLIMKGKTYPKGLGVHSISEVVYRLDGSCSSFSSDVGINDFRLKERIGKRGSVVFQVYLDGVKKYDTGIVRGDTATQKVALELGGARELKLVTTDAGDGRLFDHADWADAKLNCAVGLSNPRNFSGVSNSPSSVKFDWETVQGAFAYVLDRKNADGTYSNVSSFEAPGFAIAGNLTPNTLYTFRLKAVAGSKESSGVELTVKTQAEKVTLPNPQNFSATSNSTTSVSFNWDNVQEAYAYLLERKNADGTFSYVSSFESSGFAGASNLTPNTRYTFRLKAVAGPLSSSGVEATVQTQAISGPPQGYVTNFSAQVMGFSKATLQWSALLDASSYQLERAEGNSEVYTALSSPNPAATRFEDSNLSANTRYSYRVRALNSFGAGGWSYQVIQTPIFLP